MMDETDTGRDYQEKIRHLEDLIALYRNGIPCASTRTTEYLRRGSAIKARFMAVLFGDVDRSNISFQASEKQIYRRKLQHRDSPQNYKRSCKAARTCPVFGMENQIQGC